MSADHPWPTVSVVVPVLDAEATLERCVRSVLGQDYPRDRLELLFVDNGSQDRSREILESHRPAIAVLHEPTRGPAAARNAGVRVARHEFIAFLDADAVAEPDWVRELIRVALERPEVDFIGGQVAAANPDTPGRRYEATLRDQRAGIEDFDVPFVDTANLLMRRARLVELGLFDESFRRGEDSELSFRGWLEFGSRFAYAGRAVVRHHNRGGVGLFRLGIQHGWANAHLWSRHGARLNGTTLGRLLDRHALAAGWKAVAGRAWPEALFRIGRFLGLVAGTIRWGGP